MQVGPGHGPGPATIKLAGVLHFKCNDGMGVCT